MEGGTYTRSSSTVCTFIIYAETITYYTNCNWSMQDVNYYLSFSRVYSRILKGEHSDVEREGFYLEKCVRFFPLN